MFDSLRKRISDFVDTVTESSDNEVSKSTKVKAALTGSAKLSDSEIDDMLWKLQTELIQSDVAVETADYLAEQLKGGLEGLEVSAGRVSGDIRGVIKGVLEAAMDPTEPFDLEASIGAGGRPYTIIFLGVNGTGKTTSMAKMAQMLTDLGYSVVFAAGDTFRAGAIEQLKEHAKRLGVKVISHQRGADAAAVIYDAIEHAKARGVDLVLADTAGRMQSKVNLMDELEKIIRVNSPDAKLFVADALAGNDAVEQARAFEGSVGFDGAILSKMDADAKGGAALSIVNTTGRPILYIGTGQSYGDLKAFDKDWFISSIMGD